ncbi:hypothetical protein KM043_016637 [Ampulex compressa]|nr:hypothetical protein KM043_016637 [Ampulex compressa]
MRISHIILFCTFIQVTSIVATPAVAGILVSIAVSVITMLIKQGLKALIRFGVGVADKAANDRMKKIAGKVTNHEKLTDDERDKIIKGVLIREIVEKIYHTDYDCEWMVHQSEIRLSFHFNYTRGHNLTRSP